MNASWVAIDLMEFAVRTEDVVQSPEAALEWLRSFRDTLLMEGRNSRPMPWAVELLGMAGVKIAKKSIARMQGQIVKIFGKDCDVDLECSKKYGEKYEKLKNILAAAATREGVDESTTGCNHYDQETKVSTNSPACDGVNLDITHKISPDASDGNAEGVNTNGSPITRNGSRATCTSATSWQTFDTTETLDKAGAGEVPPENVSAPSPALSVPSKKVHGEFGNVMLTDDEFAKLCEKCPDADALITELDQYIESQGKTKKYKSHYATLLNWSRRKAKEAKPKQGFKTAAEKQRDELQKIADYYASKEVVG